jgi:hypothetical protein
MHVFSHVYLTILYFAPATYQILVWFDPVGLGVHRPQPAGCSHTKFEINISVSEKSNSNTYEKSSEPGGT